MSVGFNINTHNQFVQFHGQKITYFKESPCPCTIDPYTPDSNRPLLNCVACAGFGHIYSVPQTILGLVTSIRNQKDLLDVGIAAPGDLVLGMAPGATVYLNDFDMVQLPNLPLGFFGQVIVRGAGVSDTLPYTPSRILRVFSANPTTGVVTDYTTPTDYTVSGRTITWVTGHGPNPSTNYTFSANVIYDWIVFVSAMERQDGQTTNLGQRALLRKRNLVFPTTVQ